MKPQQIKARLIERAGTIKTVAEEIKEPRSQISATIHYLRVNQRIREKLSAKYGVRFNDHWRRDREERKAA